MNYFQKCETLLLMFPIFLLLSFLLHQLGATKFVGLGRAIMGFNKEEISGPTYAKIFRPKPRPRAELSMFWVYAFNVPQLDYIIDELERAIGLNEIRTMG